jgi:NAD(P)-dependent dehydrogenase (short-subunit alcohol dehydrogenase family)
MDVLKVAVTGHTRGIGKAISQVFVNHKHDVTGFSSSNGYDIGTQEIRDSIIAQSQNLDVFVNNAYHPTGQSLLLQSIIESWKETDKLIINISSKMVFYPGTGFEDYVSAKKEQNKIVEKTFLSNRPKVLNILLGAVDTDMAKVWLSDKIDPTILANFIYSMVEYQDALAVQQVTIDVPKLNWKDVKYVKDNVPISSKNLQD